LLGKLTGLRIQSLLSAEAKPEYRQDEPALEVKMTRKGGEVLSYHFSKLEDASYYALKRSDLDHYFKVVEYTVAPVKETAGENLVQTRTDKASSEPSGDKRDEKDNDASADGRLFDKSAVLPIWTPKAPRWGEERSEELTSP